MATKALELCAVRKDRLWVAWSGNAYAFVLARFDRKSSYADRLGKVIDHADSARKWHCGTGPHFEVCEGLADLCPSQKHFVWRAMRVALTDAQEKQPRAFNKALCPAQRVVAGWAWINEGIDTEKHPSANFVTLLHVATGMRIWHGQASTGKDVFAALCLHHSHAFSNTPFGETPKPSAEVDAVKETIRPYGGAR